jgi:hypothetical protein
MPLTIADKPHSFTRCTQTLYQVKDGVQFGSMPFSLNALPDYTEFVDLFDSYRITRVDCTFIPTMNTALVYPGNAAATLPVVYIAEDRNDDASWISVANALQLESLQVGRMDKIVKFTCYPKCALAAYSSLGFTSYTQVGDGRNIWVDTNSPGVKFYGLKWAVDASGEGGTLTTNVGHYDVICKYYLDLKEVS